MCICTARSLWGGRNCRLTPGSLRLVSAEIWEKDGQDRRGRNGALTYQLRSGIPLQLMWSLSVCQDDSCYAIFSCKTQLRLDFPLQFLQKGFSSCLRFTILCRSRSIVLTSYRPASSLRVTLGGRRRRGLQGGTDVI